MKYIAMLLLLPVLAATALVQADQVYKWVDAQGNVHYSDKPHPGSEKVKIASPQSYSAPAVSGTSNESGAQRIPPAHQTYSLTIASPKPDSTIWNTRSVTVSVSVSPGLSAGDSITFELDGRRIGPVNRPSATFDDLDRGQHSVSATLTTADGQTITAGPVTFYLRQTTVFHGKPPG